MADACHKCRAEKAVVRLMREDKPMWLCADCWAMEEQYVLRNSKLTPKDETIEVTAPE